MDDWKLPDYRAARGERDLENLNGSGAEDDETLLADHDEASEDGEKGGEDDVLGSRGGMKSSFWMVLMTLATLAGRRILNGGFPYPFYFVLLIQLGAYTCVAIVVLLSKLKYLRSTRRKSADEKYTWLVTIFIGFRILLSSSIGALSILCGAHALLHFPNLPILAMLPILTYVSDSFFFRFAYAIHLLPRGQSTSPRKIYRIVLIALCVCAALYDDYRLNLRGLAVLLAGFVFASLAKVASKIGPRIETRGTESWESPLQVYLLAGIPPLILAGVASTKFENIVAASASTQTWTWLYKVINLGPSILLQIVFGSSMLSAYPFISQEHVGGALEEMSDHARDAVASTLQAGFWTFVIGVLGNEMNFITWIQVIAFTFIYILSVGPKHIGYYPPRFFNLVFRLFRRRPLPIHAEPWQFSIVLVSTTIVFAILLCTNTTFWVDTIAYHHNLKTWLGPDKLILDNLYRPPELRSFDVVIAHSAGDPIESITTLVNAYVEHSPIGHLAPRVKVYTKDPSFNLTEHTPESLRGDFGGELSVQTIRNTGGVSATFLHHILYHWESLAVQSIFLNTRPKDPELSDLVYKRWQEYFLPASFPLPDAMPKTGFLNLGEHEPCWCGGCFDTLGWEDTFHLVPSMWSAARPGSLKCESVLLTYGNNFVASSARIRGVKREVWQLLYDALVNEDKMNAWAHAPEKIPKKLEGEVNKGRWAEGAVYGQPDSVEKPYLDYTVERLWGTLLQCSTGEIAWKCPSLEREWRTGGNREDCGCIE